MKFVVEVDLDHRSSPDDVANCLHSVIYSIENACGSVESLTEKRFGVHFAGKLHDRNSNLCIAQYGTRDEAFIEVPDSGPVRARTNEDGEWEKVEVPE